MKLSFQTELMKRLIDAFKSIPSSKSDVLAFGGIYLKVSDGVLVAEVANAEGLNARTTIPLITNSGVGEMLFPADAFASSITSLRDDVTSINYSAKTKSAKIVSGSESGKIAGYDPDIFPSLKDSDGVSMVVPVDLVLGMVSDVSHAASHDDEITSHAMKSIYFEFVDNTLSATALDTFRIASVFNHPLEKPCPNTSVMVNAKHMTTISRVINGLASQNNMSLKISDNRISFSVGDLVVSAPKPNGDYPEYWRMRPTTIATRIIVELEQLQYALGYISAISSNVVEIDVKPHEGHLYVSAWDDDSKRNAESCMDLLNDPDEAVGEEAHAVYNMRHFSQQIRAYSVNKIDKVEIRIAVGDNRIFMLPYGSESEYALFSAIPDKTHMQIEDTVFAS